MGDLEGSGGLRQLPEVPSAVDALVASRAWRLMVLVRSGSKSYGLEIDSSDDDYAGVFVPSLRELFSIQGLSSETVDGRDPDFTLHEIAKFCRLGLKGNPAILETLWNPDLLHCDRFGRELRSLRGKFLHRGSLIVYVSYAQDQLKKMVRGLALHTTGGEYNGKYGVHLIRLLHSGLRLAETGEVTVRVPEEVAETLRRIRSGEIGREAVQRMAEPLLEALRRMSKTNDLPSEPDRDAIEDLVLRARLASEGR